MIVSARSKKYREQKRGSPYQLINFNPEYPLKIGIAQGVDIDLNKSPRFEAELFGYLSEYGHLLKGRKVVVDVSPAHSLSSAVLAILEKTKKRVKGSGGTFQIEGLKRSSKNSWAGIYIKRGI